MIFHITRFVILIIIAVLELIFINHPALNAISYLVIMASTIFIILGIMTVSGRGRY